MEFGVLSRAAYESCVSGRLVNDMTPRALPLIVLLGLSVLKGSASDVEPNMHTTVAAGTPGGYYQKVCSAMHDVALQHSIDIGCITSYGSQENVYDLEQNKAEFAMVQSDVAHRAWKGEYPFDEKHEGNIRLVMPLFRRESTHSRASSSIPFLVIPAQG